MVVVVCSSGAKTRGRLSIALSQGQQYTPRGEIARMADGENLLDARSRLAVCSRGIGF